MNAPEVKHLTEELLTGYASDSLDVSKANEVGRHLLQCENCRNLLPAPTPQQIFSALFSEKEDLQQGFPQESFLRRSWSSHVFSSFHNGRSLAWSAGALIIAASFSLLLWDMANKQPNITTELNKTDSMETHSLGPAVDDNSPTSSAEKYVSTQNEERSVLREIPNKIFNKLPLFETKYETNKIKSVKTPEEIELAQLIEKTPAAVLSVRSNDTAVLRKNSSGVKTEKTFQLINPVGETVIETAPEFHWEKAADAKSYRISIFDADFNEVLTTEVSGNHFKPDQSLKSGAKYLWRVAAQTEDGEVIAPQLPQPPAIFRIAPTNVESRIKFLKKNKDASFKLALFYAREGMLDSARCTLKRILTENPKYRAAQNLLRKVEQWRKENKTGVQRCGGKEFLPKAADQ